MSAAPDERDWEELNRHLLPKFRHRHKPAPVPPPPKPPPPKPPASWALTNGPWIFVESDPGTCRTGPWTRLDIEPNEVCEGAPLWECQGGFVPQAEGGSESTATIEWIDNNWHHDGNIAPVTTLGINVQPYLDRGITSCFVECYLQGQPNALDKYGEAFREGWPDAIPIIGVGWSDQNGTFHVADYVGWLTANKIGKRFGVYASDPMTDKDWADLEAYLG